MKKWLMAALLLGAGVTVGSLMNTSAETSSVSEQPGSVNDPLVSKSYLDEQLTALVKAEMNKQTINVDKINSLVVELEEQRKKGFSLTVVAVAKDQTLIAGEGAEFILRAGKATAIGSGGGGIPDLTGGVDLKDGVAVPLNHLLLFPRADGRGLKANSTLTVMVRGPYSLNSSVTVTAPANP